MLVDLESQLATLPFQPDIYLLAVSGGSDSMTLLDLFIRSEITNFAVVHINHKLRIEADEEQKYLQDLCQEKQIPFFSTSWHKPATANVEGLAREFRYEFFKTVMLKYQKPVLLMAHHQDDQIETLLQQLIEGGDIFREGIPYCRQFANGYLLRPFLTISKSELQDYVKQRKIKYFEDQSNHELTYKRNRIRNVLLPLLEEENPKFKANFLEQFEQLQLIKKDLLAEGKEFFLNSQIDDGWDLTKVPVTKQHIFQIYLINYLRKRGFTLNQRQVKELEKLLNSIVGTKQIQLDQKWYLQRTYTTLHLNKIVEKSQEAVYTLDINDNLFLSENEYLNFGLKPVDLNFGAEWEKYILQVSTKKINVRTIRPGDKILIGPDMHKKLARIMIDQKIPQNIRSKLRVISDFKTNEVLGLLPVRNSYLSKLAKTDKIYYITYYYRKSKGENMLEQDIEKVFYSKEEIDRRTEELGKQLSQEYMDKVPLMVGILKGSIPFMANLVKNMTCQLEMDFMSVSSYHGGTESSGKVEFLKDLDMSIEDRDVLIVEDIIDTGRTLKAIVENLRGRGAKSVKIVTLLDKKEGRVVEIEGDYVGFECPNEFVVGYGLDYDEKYRQLPYIGILKPEVYAE